MVKNSPGQMLGDHCNHSGLDASPLCPVGDLTAMCRAISATFNEPLFFYYKPSSLIPLTDSMARKISRHGVSIQDIQAQSTLTSEALWCYIHLPPSATSAVSSAFTSHLYTWLSTYTGCLGGKLLCLLLIYYSFIHEYA